jgi:GPH family glycoside/pentoside/hexuronide:cation symporter
MDHRNDGAAGSKAGAGLQRPGRGSLTLLAFGDFAFNLYWQSVMLYLLFYYTDALGLPVAAAATAFMVASIWDGIANFLAGLAADRRAPSRSFGAILTVGALPLALTFVLAWVPPPATGAWAVGAVFITHLLFRTVYAAVNVPYLTLSARISLDDGDRAYLAGARMLFGTLAAVVVALGATRLGGLVTAGRADGPYAYLGAAVVFAVAGAAILMSVGRKFSALEVTAPSGPRAPLRAALASLLANRAFVTLNLAMMAMIIAITVLNKSVLYYFKYVLGDESAGQLALAAMSAVSAIAVPIWMVLARPLGLRVLWFLAAGGACAGLVAFAVFDPREAAAVQVVLTLLQAATVGLHFVFWAMLPNTVEFGQRQTGLRVEGAVFGLAALLQRVAIGLATALLGWSFNSSGYVANAAQSAETLQAMRWTVVAAPLTFLALSCLLMALNPLRKGAHAKLVRDLADRGAA